MTETESSTSTMPSTDGPITIPARISSTTEGNFTAGKNPSRSGAANATATATATDDDQQVVERRHR